ncbi:MAG: uracil-DNA glycosylase [Anaerolineae bacterium CG_4_9_14_0_8_um_filter_58_9]|nr:MAG: uracil-DNA glycosylase [Anaerolineae bacterium CG_4_9_14_0_8_um_filter_58_9]
MLLNTLNSALFQCRRCPRLVAWREEVARLKRRAFRDWEYWGKPVPGFGDPQARVMAVGLAPGAHGSNRTGRMFTGDASGEFLYAALFRAGFASQPESHHRADGLTLNDIYITAVCRCAPPGNKPTPQEMANCQPYLEREIEHIQPKVIVALGRIAFDAILRLFGKPPSPTFAHGAVFSLPASSFISHPSSLLCSYHPSRQNTQTGRLTTEMFDAVWRKVRELLDQIPR